MHFKTANKWLEELNRQKLHLEDMTAEALRYKEDIELVRAMLAVVVKIDRLKDMIHEQASAKPNGR